MQNFVLWCVEQLPAFLMAEPICYFVGFFFVFFAIKVFKALVHI